MPALIFHAESKGFIRIEKNALEKLKKSFSGALIESGGMIGSKNGVIVDFCFDNGGDPEKYVPNVEKLNKKIAEWQKSGISFAGIVHSHHNDCRLLSDADINYARTILKSCSMASVCFPIVTYRGEEIIVTPYKIGSETVEKADFLVIDD